MILTKEQAVYGAMCALNNVMCDNGHATFLADRAQDNVRVNWNGGVTVLRGELRVAEREEYSSQWIFANTYGLQ